MTYKLGSTKIRAKTKNTFTSSWRKKIGELRNDIKTTKLSLVISIRANTLLNVYICMYVWVEGMFIDSV